MRRLLFTLLLLLLVPLAAGWLALSDPAPPSLTPRAEAAEPDSHGAVKRATKRPRDVRRRRTRRKRSRKADPIRRALDPAAKETAFFRWADFRKTEIGEYVLSCLGDTPMRELDEKLGVDIAERIDRFAVQENAAVFTGDFTGANFSRLVDGAKPTEYGDRAQLYDSGAADGVLAVWDEQVVIVGPNLNAVEAAVDRLEGRNPGSKLPVLPGHASGTLPAHKLVDMLPVPYKTKRALRQQMDGAQAWFSIYADDGFRIAIELAHHDPDRLREAQEGAAGVLQSMPIGGWLPIRYEQGVFEADVSGDLIRNLMPCARPTL